MPIAVFLSNDLRLPVLPVFSFLQLVTGAPEMMMMIGVGRSFRAACGHRPQFPRSVAFSSSPFAHNYVGQSWIAPLTFACAAGAAAYGAAAVLDARDNTRQFQRQVARWSAQGARDFCIEIFYLSIESHIR